MLHETILWGIGPHNGLLNRDESDVVTLQDGFRGCGLGTVPSESAQLVNNYGIIVGMLLGCRVGEEVTVRLALLQVP